jgi:hypothetical protein
MHRLFLVPAICWVFPFNPMYYCSRNLLGSPCCLWIQAVVTNLDDAHEQIDTAVATALRESKPVYLSISCNLPGIPHPTFTRDPVPFFLAPRYQSFSVLLLRPPSRVLLLFSFRDSSANFGSFWEYVRWIN